MTGLDLTPLHQLVTLLDPTSSGAEAVTALVAAAEESIAEARRYLDHSEERKPEPSSADQSTDTPPHPGWCEIFQRTDATSYQVIRIAAEWWPFALPRWHEVVVADGFATGGVEAEWVQRLSHVDTPSAQYALIDAAPDEAAAYMVDPLSGAPIVRWLDGQLCAALPGRLPKGTAALDEIIFSRRKVWIRLNDGTVYPAPGEAMYYGPGSERAPALAVLIEELLDDITCEVSGASHGASTGLESLMDTAWPDGTAMTRSRLERARRGRS